MMKYIVKLVQTAKATHRYLKEGTQETFYIVKGGNSYDYLSPYVIEQGYSRRADAVKRMWMEAKDEHLQSWRDEFHFHLSVEEVEAN